MRNKSTKMSFKLFINNNTPHFKSGIIDWSLVAPTQSLVSLFRCGFLF
jgi:hypothetical protein